VEIYRRRRFKLLRNRRPYRRRRERSGIIMRPSSLGGAAYCVALCLSVRLSVCLSVRPVMERHMGVIVTERHVAPPSELQ